MIQQLNYFRCVRYLCFKIIDVFSLGTTSTGYSREDIYFQKTSLTWLFCLLEMFKCLNLKSDVRHFSPCVNPYNFGSSWPFDIGDLLTFVRYLRAERSALLCVALISSISSISSTQTKHWKRQYRLMGVAFCLLVNYACSYTCTCNGFRSL